MPRYQFRPVSVATTGAQVRFDTTSGTNTPADIATDSFGPPLAGATIRSDAYTGALPTVWGPNDVRTLYQKTLDSNGAPTGEVTTLFALGQRSVTPAAAATLVSAPVCGEFGDESTASTSGGGHLGVNTMMRRVLPPDVSLDYWSLRFSNTRTVFQAGEQDNAHPVAFRASVGLTPTGPWFPVSTRGTRVVSLDGGAYVDTDPLHVAVPPGGTFYVKVYAAVTSGQVWSLHNPAGVKGTTYWVSSGAAETDLSTSTAAFTATSSSYPFAPVAVIDHLAPSTRLSVFVVGDSIASGLKDDHIGFALRAFGGAVCYQRSTTSGVTLQHYAAPETGYRRLALGRGCNVVLEMLATNDINNNRTLAQLQADKLQLWNQLRLGGRRPVFTTTTTPWSNSTDGWVTVANQTVKAQEPVRVALNDWIRAGAPIDPVSKTAVTIGTPGALVKGTFGHPLYDYFDVAAAVESGPNSGKWKLNPGDNGRLTDDGVHPLNLGNILMAQAVDVAKLAASLA